MVDHFDILHTIKPLRKERTVTICLNVFDQVSQKWQIVCLHGSKCIAFVQFQKENEIS